VDEEKTKGEIVSFTQPFSNPTLSCLASLAVFPFLLFFLPRAQKEKLPEQTADAS